MDQDSSTSVSILIGVAVLLAFVFLFLLLCSHSMRSKIETQQKFQQKFENNHTKKVETFKAGIRNLEQLTSPMTSHTPPVPNVDKERELFEMYYKGVPDTYTTSGKLIKGVEPDAHKAIHYLSTIIKSPYGTPKDSMSLAKIYHFGMHKFERNLDKAEGIYSSLKFDGVTMETMASIKEALADIQKIRVYAWLNLPLEPPVQPTQPVRPVQPVQPVQLTQPRANSPVIVQPVVNLPGLPRPPAKLNQKEYNDPQNTHDPQVLSTIRQSLNKLKMNTVISKTPGLTSTEIRSYLYALPDSDKKEDALKSLRGIESNLDKLSSTDMTEMDALTLVWNRINESNRFDKEVIGNLKETLYDELASMQEFGVTICSTGRFTHIIDTLNGVDEDVSIKPKYAINEEMMLASSNIREKMYQEQTTEERERLEKGTSSVQDEFETSLKTTIMTKLKEDYVTTGILTEASFLTEINKWIDYI